MTDHSLCSGCGEIYRASCVGLARRKGCTGFIAAEAHSMFTKPWSNVHVTFLTQADRAERTRQHNQMRLMCQEKCAGRSRSTTWQKSGAIHHEHETLPRLEGVRGGHPSFHPRPSSCRHPCDVFCNLGIGHWDCFDPRNT